MQAYLEDVSIGAGEPINVRVTDENGSIQIEMTALSKQSDFAMVLHIDKDCILEAIGMIDDGR